MPQYLRAVPLVALIALGWYRPQVAGWTLIVLGAVFAALYAATVPNIQLVPTALIALIFFVPIILSGYVFLQSHKKSLPA